MFRFAAGKQGYPEHTGVRTNVTKGYPQTGCLAVFIAYASSSLEWALGTQLLAFPLLLAVDFQLFRKGLIDNHYLGMRFIATALACFSLLFILVYE